MCQRQPAAQRWRRTDIPTSTVLESPQTFETLTVTLTDDPGATVARAGESDRKVRLAYDRACAHGVWRSKQEREHDNGENYCQPFDVGSATQKVRVIRK